MVKIGIIGGSGLDDPKLLQDFETKKVDTPYGKPSSDLTIGKIDGIDVVILARHGNPHTITPTNIPNRANITALKDEGCTNILATSACGSLRDKIRPGDFVVVNQFIDMTKKRDYTFFDKDKVGHVPMDEPFCEDMRNALMAAAVDLHFENFFTGTVITIEGPRFSTKAESRLWQTWGADVINMTTVPECVLAREAGMCYAVICMATDYDTFVEGQEVNMTKILEVFKSNTQRVKQLIVTALPRIKDNPLCHCRTDVDASFVK